MPRHLPLFALWLCWNVVGSADASPPPDGAILPASVVLDHARASQRLVVEAIEGDVGVKDLTAESKLVADDPRVVRIDSEGTIHPVGNGTTMIHNTVGGRTAPATVVVKNIEHDRPWSFRNHVLPVLTKAGCNQGACHGAAAGKNGFRLTLRGYGPEVDYDVLTRQTLGRRLIPGMPEESLVLLKATGTLPHGGGVKIDPASLDYRVLAGWIAEGIAKPSESDAKIVSIGVYPQAVRLKKGDQQRLIVQARYDDGRIEDVTHWSKFSSADDGVARVDEAGRITVMGSGEASTSVWFASMVSAVTVTSPYVQAVDPRSFAQAPKRNPVDEWNLEKLKALNIPPSPDAGDAAFLRRATLDATGQLPTIAEVDAFLTDRDPRKREKLVERLLDSDAYVDYWAYKWSDLFLVSSKKLPAPAMWAFYRFLRRAVADNQSWDQICRSVLTAKGSSLTNGAANYFVLHRDPIDLTESASMAFLGLAMTCARCHNHPMEKWTQDQYYGMANLFARVQIKDGPATGDAIVMASPEGDIPHPRSGAILSPQPLDGQAVAVSDRRDRRESFADWLVAPENPYFARSIVNRVWRNFFARGLVDPEDDLRATNPASDERLLRWLVDDFTRNKYDIKHLIRKIMNSAVYARSSEPIAGNEMDQKFLSHYVPERLPAEVLLDAIAQVTEVPTAFSGYPSGWRSQQLPDSKPESGFLDTFGRPERLSTCSCERSSEPSMSQALHLANGSTVNEKLRDPKSVVAKAVDAGLGDDAIIDRLFKSALNRPARPAELSKLREVLADAAKGAADPKAARKQAVEDIYWATLTGKEFLFNH